MPDSHDRGRNELDPALDEMLSALLDGELDAATERELRARLVSDAGLAQRLAELEAVDAQLRALPSPAVPNDLRDRLRARIERDDPPQDALAPPQRARRRWPAPAVGAALAAGLAIYLVTSPPRGGRDEAARDPDTALAEIPDDELAIAIDYDTLRDFELIDQLELLEALADYEDTESSG